MSQEQTKDYGTIGVFDRGVSQELGIIAAIAFGQLHYWHKIMNKTGKKRFYKTYAEMAEETTLSEKQLRSAYKKLVDAGYINIEIHRANNSPTCHFKVLKTAEYHTYQTLVSPLQKVRNNDTAKRSETLTLDYHKTTTTEQKGGGLFNRTTVAQPTDSQLQNGAVIEAQPTDAAMEHSSASLNSLDALASYQDNSLDASANQENGRLTNQQNNVLTTEQWKQLTDLLTPNEAYKPEFNPILSQVLASANPQLSTKSPFSQLLSAVKHRSTDAYIADKPHLKTMSVFLKSEIGGVPVWLSCMTEGNKRKSMF